MFIYPYKKGSKGAKSLSKVLGCKVLTRPKKSRKGPIINWGNSLKYIHNFTNNKVMNHPFQVHKASNKLSTFEVFKASGIDCPDYTTNIEVAKDWITDGEIVVCRKLLRSHSGKGIVIATKIEELVNAPLYVKYFHKSYEYRVHVFNGNIIDAVKKRKRNNAENYNKYIRCHSNGWVFCREGLELSDKVKTLALNSVKALGLDFGAVDIITKTNGNAIVLEVNTAPALTGTTLESYKKAITEWSTNV